MKSTLIFLHSFELDILCQLGGEASDEMKIVATPEGHCWPNVT